MKSYRPPIEPMKSKRMINLKYLEHKQSSIQSKNDRRTYKLHEHNKDLDFKTYRRIARDSPTEKLDLVGSTKKVFAFRDCLHSRMTHSHSTFTTFWARTEQGEVLRKQ